MIPIIGGKRITGIPEKVSTSSSVLSINLMYLVYKERKFIYMLNSPLRVVAIMKKRAKYFSSIMSLIIGMLVSLQSSSGIVAQPTTPMIIKV